MRSTASVLDQKIATAEIRSFDSSVHGDQRAAIRFLSDLKEACMKRKVAWQVYNAVKKQAQSAGLIPQ